MKRNNTKTEKPKNVFRIADNPKWTDKKMIAVERGANPGAYVTFTLVSNHYGLFKGDTLICKTDFNPDEIKDSTLVIAETPDGMSLTCNVSDISTVCAVVWAYQREF
jgi:hypothetical protein